MTDAVEQARGARAEMVGRVSRSLTWAGVLSNGLGGALVISFLMLLAPTSLSTDQIEEIARRVVPFALGYLAVTLPLGWWLIARRPFERIGEWVNADVAWDDEMRRKVIIYPRNWAVWSAGPWVGGVVGTVVITALTDEGAAVAAGAIVLAAGLVSCALQYLIVERLMRPVVAVALEGASPPRVPVPGVAVRTAMAWLLGSGVPLMLIAWFASAERAGADFDSGETIRAILVVAASALAIGFAATLLVARSIGEPLGAMRSALSKVQSGDLEVRVPVDDGTEVGLLEAGFNRMTDGLGERERLREAFGTFIDPDLARRVMEEGTDLAGEEVELSVLFLDVRGFTTLSEQDGPRQVVARLNALYEQVVPIVLDEGGQANKFIGDGLLAVFGAPVKLDSHADRAVSAALRIAGRARQADDLEVGVGVNSGRALVGTIGGGGRLDFTVIGDAVNTAARVESQTRQTGDDVLITAATRALLREDHGEWTERGEVTLKGKSAGVRLLAPA
jgi:adenylate cyclase